MGAHDPGERVDVGHGDRFMPERRGTCDEFLRMACPTQEGEVTCHVQVGVGKKGTDPFSGGR
jgi:hypothetical protein